MIRLIGLDKGIIRAYPDPSTLGAGDDSFAVVWSHS
jgi:hypothetical protein